MNESAVATPLAVERAGTRSLPSLLTNENWLAVWTGLLLVLLVVGGLRLPLPAFSLGGADLLATVLSPTNLWRALEAGVALVIAGFATMLASAVSICGVSAAIAICGAIQGERKKLSYVTSLVLIVAAPMMVLMPLVIKAVGMPDAVGGAWLGGTLDTSASVVAAGDLFGGLILPTPHFG